MRLDQPCLTAFCFTLMLLLIGTESSRRISSRYAGPYKIKFLDFNKCDSPEVQDMDPLIACNERNKSHNECDHVNGSMILRRDINKAYPLTVTLNQWRDREWKKDAVVMKFPDAMLTFRQHLTDIYHQLFKEDTRPKKGEYILDQPLKLDIKAIPVFPYGRWKGHIEVLEDRLSSKPPMCCVTILLDIVPK